MFESCPDWSARPHDFTFCLNFKDYQTSKHIQNLNYYPKRYSFGNLMFTFLYIHHNKPSAKV